MNVNYDALVESIRRKLESDESLRKGGTEPPTHRDIAFAIGLPDADLRVDAVWRMFKPYMDELHSLKAWPDCINDPARQLANMEPR